MELAIPLIALGGMYIISNQNKEDPVKETFKNKLINDLPTNYPVENKEEVLDTDYKYSNPNTTIDSVLFPLKARGIALTRLRHF